MIKDLKRDWDKRSEEFKDSMQGVMFASFPNTINDIFHKWELDILLKNFPRKESPISVLDIGCGYGRLSLPLSIKYPKSHFSGIDISKSYVDIFNKKIKNGKAVYGDLKKLPYKDNSFDFIFVITVLMYLKEKELKSLLNEVRRVLKKNGTFVVIENNKSGVDYITGYGLLSKIKNAFGSKNVHFVKSKVFKNNELEKYFDNFNLKSKTGCSLITFLLPFLLIISRFKKNSGNSIVNLNLPLPTLYNAYVLTKE